jgi:hypothetical protein
VRLHEGIDVLAAQAPNLHGALLAAKAPGYSHVNTDGTLIETDRVAAPGPTEGVDQWWSGKHHTHDGNVQVITVRAAGRSGPSQVRPGREHDTTAVRVHTEILPALAAAAGDLRSLGDLGYEGESQTITVAFKTPKHGKLTTMQQRLTRPTTGSGHRRAWQLAAEDDLPSTAQRQPRSLAHRCDRRRSPLCQADLRHPPS